MRCLITGSAGFITGGVDPLDPRTVANSLKIGSFLDTSEGWAESMPSVGVGLFLCQRKRL